MVKTTRHIIGLACAAQARRGEARRELRLVMQVCKRLERSKPAKRQSTVQGSGPCTLHHAGMAQTSGSSEHPGPCLGHLGTAHQRPLPLNGPTSTPRMTWRTPSSPCLNSTLHLGAAFVPRRHLHVPKIYDTAALPTWPTPRAMPQTTSERGETPDDHLYGLEHVHLTGCCAQWWRVAGGRVCWCNSAVGTATAKPYKVAGHPVLRRGWSILPYS